MTCSAAAFPATSRACRASRAWWVTLPPLGILAGAARLMGAALRYKRSEDEKEEDPETRFSPGLGEKLPGVDVWLETLEVGFEGVRIRAKLLAEPPATWGVPLRPQAGSTRTPAKK